MFVIPFFLNLVAHLLQIGYELRILASFHFSLELID
jgi:hypothetical protein